MLRRTLTCRTSHFQIGVTARTQRFANGDKFPTIYNFATTVTESTGAAASLTGNPNSVVFDTESMFDLRATNAAEKAHFQVFNGVHRWTVTALNPEEGERSAKTLTEFFASKEVDKLFWERLFKLFPSLRKPFTDEVKGEFADYFQAAARIADDEAAVAALADPFISRQWEKNFINPSTMWRITESLASAVEAHVNKTNKYEVRAVRETLERVTKIGLNTLASKPGYHETVFGPLTCDVGGVRAWHEAGGW